MQAITTNSEATYSIHRYPAHLIESWQLPDGRRATLRPVLPQDEPLEQSFVQSLSPKSRRNRFHSAVNELSPAMLKYLTQVDYRTHLGLVVTVSNDDSEIVIADACYVVCDDGETAEFAVAVSDAWQGKGIGKRLLTSLTRAVRLAGLRWLYGEVLETNVTMLRLMRTCGFHLAPHTSEVGVMRVEKSVDAPEPCHAKRGFLRMIADRFPEWGIAIALPDR